MLGSKDVKKIIDILVVDFIGCCKNLRRGMEPWTNGARATSIILGLGVGGAVTGSLAPNALNNVVSSMTGGYELSDLAATSIDVAYVVFGLMICARVFDCLAKYLMAAYYYCRYRTPELYKPMTYKEIEIIHNNIAKMIPAFKSTQAIRDSNEAEGLSPVDIENSVHTVIAGTRSMFEEIRKEIFAESDKLDDPKALNEWWLSARMGRIESVCRGEVTYVKSTLIAAFPCLNLEIQNINTIIHRMSLIQSEKEEKQPQANLLPIPTNESLSITIQCLSIRDSSEPAREQSPELEMSDAERKDRKTVQKAETSAPHKAFNMGAGVMFSETVGRLKLSSTGVERNMVP